MYFFVNDIKTPKQKFSADDNYSLEFVVPSNKTKHPKPQFHVRNKAKNRIDILSYNFFRNGTMQIKCTWRHLQKCRFSGTIKPNPDLLEPRPSHLKNTKSEGYRNRTVRKGYEIIEKRSTSFSQKKYLQ